MSKPIEIDLTNQGLRAPPASQDRAGAPTGSSPVPGLEQSRSSHGAVRRTICDFATSPRDGTPFHILNTMRFNPLMERFEVLVHNGDDPEQRFWRPASLHCEPSVWLRRVPLPYEIPDGQWFPVGVATYLVRSRKSLLMRILDRLFRRAPTAVTLKYNWQAAEWSMLTTEIAQAIEARSAATGTGAVEDESAVPEGCAHD